MPQDRAEKRLLDEIDKYKEMAINNEKEKAIREISLFIESNHKSLESTVLAILRKCQDPDDDAHFLFMLESLRREL